MWTTYFMLLFQPSSGGNPQPGGGSSVFPVVTTRSPIFAE